jgi:hypothetical protein
MPKTVVGLFEDPELVDEVVCKIEKLGFPRQEIRAVTEPANFDVTGVMSFPRLDFEVDLNRGLTRIGVPEWQAKAYIQGLQRGGALVFATGPADRVEEAAVIMNLSGAVDIELRKGLEPRFASAAAGNMTPIEDAPVLAGRIREPGGGAAFFVW